MRYGSNCTAKHLLFQRVCHSNFADRISETKSKVQYIFQLFTKIVICHLICIAFVVTLKLKKIADIFKLSDLLEQNQGNYMANLIGEILFFDRFGDMSLFYIVSDHGTGHILKAKRSYALIHIFSCLLQIKSHIGKLMISRETKSAQGVGNGVCSLIFHDKNYNNFILPCQSRLFFLSTGTLWQSFR